MTEPLCSVCKKKASDFGDDGKYYCRPCWPEDPNWEVKFTIFEISTANKIYSDSQSHGIPVVFWSNYEKLEKENENLNDAYEIAISNRDEALKMMTVIEKRFEAENKKLKQQVKDMEFYNKEARKTIDRLNAELNRIDPKFEHGEL